MLNQVLLIGKLTRDIEILKDSNRKVYAVVSLSIETNQRFGEVFGVDYVDCMAYGDVAMKACRDCSKGDLVAVKARVYRKDENADMQIRVESVSHLTNEK